MKKHKVLLTAVLSFLFIIVVNGAEMVTREETLTDKIINIRNNRSNYSLLKDFNRDFIFEDEEFKRDSEGNYIYSFGLGCNLDEKCIKEEDVIYSGAVTSTEYNGETISISDAANKWNNPGDGVNPDNRWRDNGMNSGTPSFTTQNAKNNYSVTYKKMNKYNNRDIDVKMTLIDFENILTPIYTVSASAVVFTNNQIGVHVTGVKWVKVKMEFFDSETHEKVKIKGNTTYWDIDQNQGIIINSDGNTNKGIYYSNKGTKCKNADCSEEGVANNQLYCSLINQTELYIFDQDSGINPNPEFRNNIYNDVKNSLAYAVSEEFEGEYIVRTIQYSNPVMVNSAGDQNIWTGHGGLFLSSKSVEVVIPRYKVITEVINGTINPDPKVVVKSGEDATITYSPNEGYVLSEIKINGEKIDLNDNVLNEYTFTNITSDQHIEVIYVKKESEVEVEEYTITTEVENGTISPDVTVDSG